VEDSRVRIDERDLEGIGPAPAVFAKIGADVPVFLAAHHFGDHKPTFTGYINRPAHELYIRQPGDCSTQENAAEIGVRRVINLGVVSSEGEMSAIVVPPGWTPFDGAN
jgi:hypothetical protein